MVSMPDSADGGAQDMDTRLRSLMPGVTFAEPRW